MKKAIVKTSEYVAHLEEYFSDQLDDLQMELDIQQVEDAKDGSDAIINKDPSGFYNKLARLANEYKYLVLKDSTEDGFYPTLDLFKEEHPDTPTHRERFILR